MQHLTALRKIVLAAPAVAAIAIVSFNAAALDEETYWYASPGQSTPDGQLWATSHGECWRSAAPDGPANLPPCQVQVAPPLVLRLNFALDRYGVDDIVNAEALRDLDAYIENVKATPRDEMLTIVGHTDKLGSWEHNLALSQNRAETIRDYMVSRGIAPDRIQSVTGVAWEGGDDVAADGSFVDLGPLENNPLRRRVVITEMAPGAG